MNRDRKAVRAERKKISVNQYDIDRVNRILDQIGGEEARLMYEAMQIGLDVIESEIQKMERREVAA